MQIITAAQCRAARALLNWSQPELAERCDIHVQTISNFEKESSTPSKTTLEKIANVFDIANIEFLGNDGVRLKSSSISHYAGKNGYIDFYDDIYTTIRDYGGDIYVSNVDEILFTDWLGTENTMRHKARMLELSKTKAFTFQILVEEGDTRLGITEIARYKWTQKARFVADIPFYIYGHKLAIILFEPNDVNVYVMNNPKIAEAYRRQFKVIWDQGIHIPEELHVNMEKFRT
ncbi:MAG: XRE family transcriptional regulator [Micavibrio aeruginosavorus]|uniref:XRE family transcriptional regulator n=1 Tax=Micavibrio aeruginosavorus TaxID=349221 RepID=A0A2W5N2S9_9BACT|nr:MAG: XRE family transcriptional regulator [Micavibrio aeruginosavorus]